MKRLVTVFLLASLVLAQVFCASSARTFDVNDYDSYPMLNRFYKPDPTASEAEWDKVEISIVTVSKSDPLYSWFGHAAVVVRGVYLKDAMYDWGRFAFGPDFYANFIMGRLWYSCCCVNSDWQMAEFADLGRGVDEIKLNLTPAQKKAVFEFLETNSSDPWNTYLYHHYKDNCSTRIRDLVDVITDGDFSRWAKAQPGFSFRQETSRILHNNIAVNWVLDFLQGPSIDVPANLWDDMFLPSVLNLALVEYAKTNPLVGESVVLLAPKEGRPSDFAYPQSYVVQSLCISIILAGAVYLMRERSRILGCTLGVVNIVLGFLGCVLFFMMFFTSHDVTYANENILFINPLLLVVAVLCFGMKKHRRIIKWFYLAETAAIAVLLALKVFVPSVFFQDNLSQIITVFPMYLTAALAL